MIARISIGALWFTVLLVPTVRTLSLARDDSCSAGSDAARVSLIREDILSKLSIFLSTNTTLQWPSSRDSGRDSFKKVDPTLIAAYEAASRALDVGDSASPPDCANTDRGRGTPAFAKSISVIFPVDDGVTYMPSEMVENREEDTNRKTTTPPTQYTLAFNLSLPSQPLYSAELRLYKHIVSRCGEGMFENVEVFYMKGEEQERVLVTTKNVDLVEDSYISFDISEAVNMWIERGSNDTLELNIIINCPFSTTTRTFSAPSIEFVTNNDSALLDSEEFEDMRPQLVVATMKNDVAVQLERKRRKRRQISDTEYCTYNPNEVRCCIRHLVLDFHTDLNLPFVLFPFTFTPNYCQGVCPIPFSTDNFIREATNQFYKSNKLGGGPCCTLYSMAPLLMMFQDPRSGQIILADVPDMEITSCGCVD